MRSGGNFQQNFPPPGKKKIMMIPQQWTSPCGNSCTHKYAALTQIPWRVFCKKGCEANGDSWKECAEDCNEICYKDPVIKDHPWSAYIDRSPGQDDNSVECYNACITGCAYKFNIPMEELNAFHRNRSPKPENVKKTLAMPTVDTPCADDVTSTSA